MHPRQQLLLHLPISQRDIVEVPFNLPQGVMNHPAIVLSVTEAIEQEEAFIAVMLTTDDTEDQYSFEIRKGMLNKDMPKKCQARLHLISFFKASQIIPNSNLNYQIRHDRFKDLIKRINQVTFGIE